MISQGSFGGKGLNYWVVSHRIVLYLLLHLRIRAAAVLLLAATVAIPAQGRDKTVLQYGAGLIINIPLPEPEVAQAVADVVQNTIIRGTKEYNKDDYIAGAIAATSTTVFPEWKEGGKVYYKVRQAALDPWNFKDSSDVGTLAVRYVVKPQGDQNTVLRIDALFVEDFRHVAHLSNGSVESAEYKDILDHLQAVELVKQETADALRAKQERLAKPNSGSGSDTISSSNPDATAQALDNAASQSVNGEQTTGLAVPDSAPLSSATPQPPAYEQSGEPLEQYVAELRRQVERIVKKPGAPLQSAPFHTATTLKSLEPGTEVLILISTPYWYGVETHDGQHGWIRRDELEQLP